MTLTRGDVRVNEVQSLKAISEEIEWIRGELEKHCELLRKTLSELKKFYEIIMTREERGEITKEIEEARSLLEVAFNVLKVLNMSHISKGEAYFLIKELLDKCMGVPVPPRRYTFCFDLIL